MKCCLETVDHENNKVIFTEEQRQKKAVKHPELRDNNFINSRLKQTINRPDFIYQDCDKPNSRNALYLKEFVLNGKPRYTKVTIDFKKKPQFVVTAYRPDYVKERNKTKLLYGHDN
jgi:hypothetical protein